MRDQLDRIVAGCLMALGLVHTSVAPIVFLSLTAPAMWFVSGGLTLIFAGAINLLRIRYAVVAPGVRRVSMAVNLSLVAFVCTYVAALGRSALRSPQAYFLLLLIPSATAFSFAPLPRLWSIHDQIKPRERKAA
ncbi:MAG: hypothetical protein HY046_12490 [Acidobacteria bacterium]|nr:hypothetical protein [Acidobacteriota bacterium]